MTHHPSHDAPTIRNATTLWDSPQDAEKPALQIVGLIDQVAPKREMLARYEPRSHLAPLM